METNCVNVTAIYQLAESFATLFHLVFVGFLAILAVFVTLRQFVNLFLPFPDNNNNLSG